MNVYINKSNYPYISGMIIVAANSIDEAHELTINSNKFIAYMKMYRYNCWKLVENLVYNGTEPKIIEEMNYVD